MIKPQTPDINVKEIREITQDDLPQILEHARDEDEINGLRFKQVDFDADVIEKIDWKDCMFDNCRLQNTTLSGSYFSECSFINCDLSGANLSDCVFSKVEFKGCKLTGAILFACGLRDVSFCDIVGDYAVLTKARVKTVLFRDCKLPHASLDEWTGRSFAFDNCGLQGVNFYRTLLKEIDMTNNDITSAMFTEYELRGAKVTALQACELSRLLGVVIVD